MTVDVVVDRLASARIVPVLRRSDAVEVRATAHRLVAAGLTAVELTATTPGWERLLSRLREELPSVLLGAGTITRRSQAEAALSAGADFLVSPYPAPAVRAVAAEHGVLFAEGGFTPAEVADAAGRGLVKLFPAHLGGVSYLRSLLAVLPGARIMPTGGISVAEVPQWLRAGAFAVGVGSDLYAGGDLTARVAGLLAEDTHGVPESAGGAW